MYKYLNFEVSYVFYLKIFQMFPFVKVFTHTRLPESIHRGLISRYTCFSLHST